MAAHSAEYRVLPDLPVLRLAGARWNDLCMASRHDVKPPSFHYQYCDDWGVWVLDHGLPALPGSLGEDDEVPVAYWAGPTFGAVLFRSWWSHPDEDEPNPQSAVNDDHHSYVRSAAGWEATGGGGGTAGSEDDPMRRALVPDRFAGFFGEWQDGPVRGVTGIVGSAARIIELGDRHGVTRDLVEAPLGLAVICFDAAEEVTIRVLDFDDRPLLEAVRTPGRW